MHQCQTVFEQRGAVTREQRERLELVCAPANGSAASSSVLGCVQEVVSQQSGESFGEREYTDCGTELQLLHKKKHFIRNRKTYLT